jgi:hypothetical protein
VFVIVIVLPLKGDFKPPKRGVLSRREAQVMAERCELRQAREGKIEDAISAQCLSERGKPVAGF